MSSELEEHLWWYHQGIKVDLSALKKSAAESLGLEFGAKDSMVCVVSQICHVQSTTLPSSLSAGVIPLPLAAEIITVNPKCAWQHSGLYVELNTMSMDLPVESVEVRSILLYMLKFTIFVDSPENDAYILSLSTSLSSTQPIPSMQSIPTMSSTPPNTPRNTDSKQNFITTIENFHSMHTSANSQWIIIKNMLKCSKLPIQTWCSLSGYIYLQVDKTSFFFWNWTQLLMIIQSGVVSGETQLSHFLKVLFVQSTPPHSNKVSCGTQEHFRWWHLGQGESTIIQNPQILYNWLQWEDSGW